MTVHRDDDTPTNPFRYTFSVGLPELLARLQVSLLVTTYQAGKLAVFRPLDGRLSLLLRSFDHAMGLAVERDRIAIGTKFQIWFLENDARVATQIGASPSCDGCYLPRQCHVTGDVEIHELAWGNHVSHQHATSPPDRDLRDQLWFVNTRFSCLCSLASRFSFVPRWRPAFVEQLDATDSCHLNGMAMRGGMPRYVTAFAPTGKPHGWRAVKVQNGCILDVASGEIIVDGLSMPHSPRWHRDSLWVLNSGHGQLSEVNGSGLNTVATMPGYTRGLAMLDRYAFVGLSKVRETSTFGNVPIANRDTLRCGVWVIDVATGRELGCIEFQQGVDEVFDVQLLSDHLNPSIVGLQKETVRHTYSLPPSTRWDGVPTVLADSDFASASLHDRRGSRVTSVRLDDGATRRVPGQLVRAERLGPARKFHNSSNSADVWYLTYWSEVDGGCHQAAKLYLPTGKPPANGWPISIWLHGLGDPAAQLFTWPLAPGRWQRTRGELAGNWAQQGIATLTPWMPGDGPSEPYGTYSPLSLSRNTTAIDDAVRMLRLTTKNGDDAARLDTRDDRFRPQLDLDRIVLRSDCIASPLLVSYAKRLRQRVGGPGIRAMVADDFLPGIVHYESILGPRVNRLDATTAAAIRCVWLRGLVALLMHERTPLVELMQPDAASRPAST